MKKLGSRGASIGGHVNNEPPSGAKYDPFWAKAEELGVPVFMHPNNAMNIARDGALDGRGELGNIVGNPLETTVFLSRMIFDGTLDRFPRLKLCAAHGGGYLPSYLGPQRCSLHRARRRELREQAQAERVLQGSDRRRLDGVLVGRACGISSRRPA